VGAALLAQSFLRLSAVDPGYRTSGPAVVMDLWLPWPEDRAAARRIGRFHEELLARIRALPGVEEAGGVSAFPLGGGGANGMFLVLHSADEIGDVGADEPGPALAERLRALAQNPERQGYAEFRIASEGYFRAMGIPLLRGRLSEEGEAPDATRVGVVSRSLAEERWPGEDPIGRLIEFGNMDGDLRPFTVIGVVGDVRERALDARPEPTLYGYVRQRPRSAFAFHVIVRGAGDPAAFIDTARAIAGELDPEAAVEFRTLEQVFSSALSDRKFTLVLMAVFGATALVLAVLGIYGVVSYLVSQRVRPARRGGRHAFPGRVPVRGERRRRAELRGRCAARGGRRVRGVLGARVAGRPGRSDDHVAERMTMGNVFCELRHALHSPSRS